MKTPPPTPSARRGFALIMALGLMSLIVLLVVALSALISVESTASQNNLMLELARQNARAALYQAVGVLQQHAGPDNVVTARAEILGDTVAHPLWTGVWSGTNSSGGAIDWLVSGQRKSGTLSSNRPQTIFTAATETVSIRGTVSGNASYLSSHGNQGGQVVVQRMKITSGDQYNNGYAWWIADEGVKASAALMSDTLTGTLAEGNNLTVEELRRARQYGPFRAGLEDSILAEMNKSTTSLESQGTQKLKQISRVDRPQGLSNIDAALFPSQASVSSASPNTSWFSDDLTGMAYGVLADTSTNTGKISLKTDLSTALLNTWTWKVNGNTNTTISRLENTSIRMPSARSDWDAWAPGLSAYLNIWKVATIQTGTNSQGAQIYEFPLTAPVAYPAITPGNRPDPQEGTPIFSVAPVLSEFLFTFGSYAYDQRGNIAAKWPTSNKGSAFTNGYCPKIKGYDESGNPIISQIACEGPNITTNPGSAMFCRTPEHLHTSRELGFDAVPWAMRLFSASEVWNPYTTDIIFPSRGKLQLRIKGVPRLQFTFYKANTLNDRKWNSKSWSRVNIDNPPADLQEILECANSSVNGWATIDLNRPVSALVAMNSFSLYAGETTPWGGMVSKGSGVIDSNRRLMSVYGIKDEVSYEMNGSNPRQSYGTPNFQFFGLTAALSFSGLLCPVVDRDTQTLSGALYDYPQVTWTAHNVRINVKSIDTPTFNFELWYIPTAGNGNALSSTPIFLSAYTAKGSDLNEGPEDSWSSENTRLASTYLIGRAGWTFARRDSSDYENRGSGRVSPHWLASNQVVSPVDLRQDKNEYAFVETTEPARSALTIDNTNPWRDADIPRLLSKKNGRFILRMKQTDAQGLSMTETISSAYRNCFNLPERDLACSAPIFELPTQRPVSLGNLQHLSLAGRRPFAIGNSWGYNLGDASHRNANAVFDQFYLSGLAPTSTTSTDSSSVLTDIDLDKPLLNGALVPLWSRGNTATFTDSTDILANFVTKGAFNVNSTSTIAWKAMLSGLWLSDWEYANAENSNNFGGKRQGAGKAPREISVTDGTESLERTFFRYPYTAGQVYTAPDFSAGTYGDDTLNSSADYTGKSLYVKPNHYRRGVRKLTQTQVDEMAQSIVKQLRQRKKPFGSMAEFLAPNSGDQSVLEKAIEAAGINDSVNDGDVSGKPELGSSVYLTQADLLNTLAPVLQARSDTFKIRAYGDVKNTSGQVEAKAICEAVVQRYPDVVENNGGTVQIPGTLGRQFRIVSIKWVNE